MSHFPDSWAVLHSGPDFLDGWAGGLPDADYKRLRDYVDKALSAAYRQGHAEAMRLHQNLDVVDWVYGYDVDWGPDNYNQHGKGENP